MNTIEIRYFTEHVELVECLHNIASLGYKRHHSSNIPATANLRYYGAIACIKPYHGRFGNGFALIKRNFGARTNYRITYYVREKDMQSNQLD